MKAVIMRLEGEYSVSAGLVNPRYGYIISPSTIAGAILHAAAGMGKDVRDEIARALLGAYLVFDEDTRLYVSTFMNRVSKVVGGGHNVNIGVKITRAEDLYAVALLDDVSVPDIDIVAIAESIPTMGWNDSIVQVREVFVERPVEVSSNYVNSYIRYRDADVMRMFSEFGPVEFFKLRENVFLRTSAFVPTRTYEHKLADYVVPITPVETTRNTVIYAPNTEHGGLVYTRDGSKIVNVYDYMVSATPNISVEVVPKG